MTSDPRYTIQPFTIDLTQLESFKTPEEQRAALLEMAEAELKRAHEIVMRILSQYEEVTSDESEDAD